MYARLLFVLSISNALLQASTTQRPLSIDTSFGTFIGLSDDSVEFNGETKSCVKFLGIPFAKPPIGNRRFSRPEPEVTRTTRHDATYYRPHCPQSSRSNLYIKYFNSSEDCLYLNIFVPGYSVQIESRFPVMIWIYGGRFAHGGADVYSGDILSAYNDVVIVTFNYRTNVFGFLDDGSGEFANNGLHDQKLAIDWVHSHIRSFGGDPGQITLFGESSGGVSVVYQTFHEENEGKIKRGIAQSGSPLASYAFQKTPKIMFDDFSARINCTEGSTAVKMECLRDKSTSEIVDQLKMLDPFLPSIDNEFLTSDPKDMLTETPEDQSDELRRFSEIDFMTGINNKDGGSLIINYWSKYHSFIPLEMGIPRVGFEQFAVPNSLRLVFGDTNDALVRATIHQYSDWSDPTNQPKIRDKIIDLSTDMYFLVPAIQTADRHADKTKAKNTYFYQFSHRPWIMKKHKWLDGALHAWEIPYVFGLTDSLRVAAGLHPRAEITRPSHENMLSLTMMKYWTNFAKTGNPNTDHYGETWAIKWPKYDSKSHNYVDLTVNMTSYAAKQRLEEARVRYWTDVVPTLIDTCAAEERTSKCSVSSNVNYNLPRNTASCISSTLIRYVQLFVGPIFSIVMLVQF